jgi:hypothetical protein
MKEGKVESLLSEISQKLSVLIALQLKMAGDTIDFGTDERRKRGVGDLARYLAKAGLDAKSISEVTGAPLTSVRTLLTPGRKK